MTLIQAQTDTLVKLALLYDDREAANICDWVLEQVTGQKRIDRLINKQATLPEEQVTRLQQIIAELQTHRPVQYVLGEAWFAGMRFFVDESVLIPRPETEELVEWIVTEYGRQDKEQRTRSILDIGSGSGCIPIALKKKLQHHQVSSIDISEAALSVARKNAATLTADIHFQQLNFLEERNWPALPVFDVIVSNPPYVKQSEQSAMAKHVLDFEPSVALFVQDEDALIFYRKIAAFGKTHLGKGGAIFLEINEALGKVTVSLYEQEGYTTELRKDLQGKDRMIKAWL
ncbi:MAG: peptide chain release factor N(5)-glutamine methyltransferase [Bacteroidetes bacterium]|nr:peptide chain release factor N(5)-glutamine methyltransferase [Bacteroidota bacterium]